MKGKKSKGKGRPPGASENNGFLGCPWLQRTKHIREEKRSPGLNSGAVNESGGNATASGSHSMLHSGVFNCGVNFRMKTVTAEGSAVGSGFGPTKS